MGNEEQGWYIECGRVGFNIKHCDSCPDSGENYGSWEGPYSFTEAKRELVAYYNCDLADARRSLRKIRALKKSDLK